MENIRALRAGSELSSIDTCLLLAGILYAKQYFNGPSADETSIRTLADAIFNRVQEAGIPWGSDPWSRENRKLNSRKGGRGVYFCDPNGHVLELLTRA